ncbi:MAG: ectoine/hydroxyectoine ABC transporter permease subunit EhuC [Pirellulaceae bacterium]
MPPPFDLLPFMLQGLGVTLVITLGGSMVALVSAILAGLGRRSDDVIVRWLSGAYIEIFRGASALVLLYWFFFALPVLLDIRVNAILAGIIVLGLNVGAYGAEVVRASIAAVPEGQYRAAKALNLTSWQTMRYVIVPQAVLAMIPPFGNLLIELLKGTALVSVVTVSDLTNRGMLLRDQTHRSLEIFGILLLVYFGLSLILTTGVRWLERRLSRGQDHGKG